MTRTSTRTRGARAVVTGAGSGIGRAFALELARRGSQVVCADIDLAAAEETVGLVEAAGGRGSAVACDVTSEDSVRDLADAAQAWFGRPTLVVNNAGIGGGGHLIGDGPTSDWRRLLEVNLWGVILGCHVFLPLLREGGAGGVINVASAAGFAAAPGMAAYNVGKAGVISLSETLAAELSGTDLKVTVLCPTFVPTNIFDGDLIDPERAKTARAMAERNGSTPESVATCALDRHDRGKLYALPQRDAQVYWRIKRFLPTVYPHLAKRAIDRPAPTR